MLLAQVLTVAINPWYLLGSAAVFINFLSSYQVFLSAITGVLLCNYYLIARGCLLVEDLYSSDKKGAYYFVKGWNIRAYVAYLVGIVPNFYGFLNNLGVSAPVGIIRFYYFAYPVGLVLSFGIFWLANCWCPPQVIITAWAEPKTYVRPNEDEIVIDAVEASIAEDEPWGHRVEKSLISSKVKGVTEGQLTLG